MRRSPSSDNTWLFVSGAFFAALLMSVFILATRETSTLRGSLPPDTSTRPPFIITTNPYPVQSIVVGNEHRFLLASLKNGYAVRLPDNTLDSLSIAGEGMPAGMSIDPVIMDIPIGSTSQRVRVRSLSWTPTQQDIGDHIVTLTSSVTIQGTTYQAEPVTVTFRVFDGTLAMTNEQLLQNVVTRNFTSASSVQNILQTFSFDDALQSMEQEELLRALLANGLITRYTSYESLMATLPTQDVDLTPLKPYGILQALATPPKGGTILRQKDPQKPWMIVQDAYDDLKMAYDADPFSLLNHYDPHHLLRMLDDRIASPRGTQEIIPMFAAAKETSVSSVAPNVIKKASLTGRRYTGNLKETEEQYRARFPQMARQIKAITDDMPEGRRVIKLQGIDRLDSELLFDGVFPPLRSSTGALIEERGYFGTNYDCSGDPPNPQACPEGPPSPTGCIDGSREYKKNHCLFSFWTESANPEEDWSGTVRSRLSTFFREYKSIGGKVDYIITDMETDWFGMYHARRIWFAGHEDHIEEDLRWSSLRALFEDRGITDFSGIKDWFVRQDWRMILWDATMSRRLAKLYNDTLFTPIRFDVLQSNAPLFPDVRFTDYEFFHHSNLSPSGGYGVFPRNIGNVGDIVGTHQSLSAYADFYPFTMPSPLETDTPDIPETLFANFMNDVKHVRTFPLTSRAPSFVWIAHPYWRRYAPDRLKPVFTDPPLQEIDDWFLERMFHLGLSGIHGYLNWTGSNLDESIINATGNIALYDRGFTVMDQGLHEINMRIGYEDRYPLVMRRVDFQDGYVLTGMEAHGKRIYRFTPDPVVTHEVRIVGDGIQLFSSSALITSIPHATAQQTGKGYWITQLQGRNMLTATPDDILAALRTP